MVNKILKVYVILSFFLTNIINLTYLNFWQGGNDKINKWISKNIQNQSDFSMTILYLNKYCHRNSLILLIVSVFLLLKKETRWYGIIGLIAVLGLFFQLYLIWNED
jgi:hypothetical protein